MEKFKTFLRELGFKKNEIEVYLALVTMKESTVLEISKKTGLHRPNTYDALNSLIKKGLAFENQNDVKKYYAREPNSILELIKRKETEFDDILKEFKTKNVIPHESRVGKSEGKLAFKEAIYGLLEKNKPIYVFGIPEIATEILGPAINQFHKERIKRKILMKHIFNSKCKRVKKLNKLDLTEARYFPEGFDLEVTTNICADKVILISWDNIIKVIEIEDEHIAGGYRKYFELLWQKAKEIN